MHSAVPLDTHTLQITAENYLKTVPQRIQGKDKQIIGTTLLDSNLFGVFKNLNKSVKLCFELSVIKYRLNS